MKEKFVKFMAGRYGNDRLNQVMTIIFLVLAALNIFVRNVYFSTVLMSWEILFLILVYVRMFSRNIAKRYAENQKYLNFKYNRTVSWNRFKKHLAQRKDYRFYKCPMCKQEVRVPKGHGKIEITCPKCREQFIRRS